MTIAEFYGIAFIAFYSIGAIHALLRVRRDIPWWKRLLIAVLWPATWEDS